MVSSCPSLHVHTAYCVHVLSNPVVKPLALAMGSVNLCKTTLKQTHSYRNCPFPHPTSCFIIYWNSGNVTFIVSMIQLTKGLY